MEGEGKGNTCGMGMKGKGNEGEAREKRVKELVKGSQRKEREKKGRK